jgi:hypothetical protein
MLKQSLKWLNACETCVQDDRLASRKPVPNLYLLYRIGLPFRAGSLEIQTN